MGTALLILGMGLACFLPRYLPLVLLADKEMPRLVQGLLGYAPAAVLAALVVPAVLTPTGPDIQLSVSNPYLVGGVVCDVTVRCAIVARADSTATGDRLYDQYISVRLAP